MYTVCPIHLTLLDIITLRVQIMKLIIMEMPPSPCYLPFLSQNVLSSPLHSVPKHPKFNNLITSVCFAEPRVSSG
jgi:hypothetical protein